MNVPRTAVVTGASSGIGAATARALRAAGFEVLLGARRAERVEALAREIGARAAPLDVTDPASVAAFCEPIEALGVLVNNAGGAKGLEPVAEADFESWRWMWESNVLGLARMTHALLPALERSGDGHIVNVGSIAGFEVYPGGAGYTSAKHGVRAITGTLRIELLGKPIRVTEIDPGLVETEFSLVRFGGEAARAANVYQGMTPLTAGDVADAVAWAVTRPSRVNIDVIVVRPRDQATATRVHRRSEAEREPQES
ncbi:MAG: SDR family NAD(P)-dependent oxidoreductase [Acidobacteria bacterium]|nr:SDR family NAD(P)-dependent oxidoreductase [Acidobacteriota bacterium]